MSGTPRSLAFCALLYVSVLTACGGVSGEINLRYPVIEPTELKSEFTDCDSLDRYLRQVDSLRWSVREDGIELETEFEQIVQLSVATAGAIAVAVPLIAIAYPDPTLMILPYAMAYTGPDYLKRLDALLIAMMAKRQELQCLPHAECSMQGEHSDTLSSLRNVREQVEKKELEEREGLEKITSLLDNLCPAGTRFLHCPGNKEHTQSCTGKFSK
jgi:hypothetical protein